MDPEENLEDQLRIARTVLVCWDDSPNEYDPIDREQDAYRLAELIVALHNWLCRGGVLPKQWNRNNGPEPRKDN